MIGVEPAAGNDTQRSLAAGERVDRRAAHDRRRPAGKRAGRLTFEVVSRLVDEIVTVTDEEIVAAMRFAFERVKLVLEPSGAAGIAALLSGALRRRGRVGVVLSGGNVGADRFAELLSLDRAPRSRRRGPARRRA